MKVTLLTPLKNERDNIERVWRSIMDQTRLPDEWIILDNGSTDGTPEWLREQAKSQSNVEVTILDLPGKSLAAMMNFGVTSAKHEIIASCHGGTTIAPTWLDELLRPFADEQIDVVAGTWQAEATSAFGKFIGPRIDLKTDTLDSNVYLPASRSMAFRRSAWQKVDGFPEWLPRFGEDTLFAIRLRDAGCRFMLAPNARVGWQPKDSIRTFLRQEHLYAEANYLMGLWHMQPKDFIRPWFVLLACLILAMVLWDISMFPALLVLTFVSDYFRLKAKGLYTKYSPLQFLFFQYVLPVSYHSGWLRAKLDHTVNINSRDQEAVRRYVEMQVTR